jgi:hypothetical protein
LYFNKSTTEQNRCSVSERDLIATRTKKKKNQDFNNTNTNMGCGASKGGLYNVDDSVHVMIKHDKKIHLQKGAPAPVFKPRSSHPMLQPKTTNGTPPPGNGANGNDPVATEE